MEFSDWWSLERSALSAVTLVGTQNLMHTNGHPRVGDSLFEPINGFLEICFCVCKISAPLLIWSERGHTLRLWKIYQALFWRKESPVSLLSTPDLGGLRLVFSNTGSFHTNIIIISILISFFLDEQFVLTSGIYVCIKCSCVFVEPLRLRYQRLRPFFKLSCK